VLSVSYETLWQGECPQLEVVVCNSPPDIGAALTCHGTFTSNVLSMFGQDVRNVGPELNRQLSYAVTKLCDEAGVEFAEQLEEDTRDTQEQD
jgi:hypothetical protein